MNKSIAIITGASSGIGKSIAIQMAQKDINVAIMARRIDRLEQLKTELEGKFKIKCFPIQVDLSDMAQAQKAFEEVVAIAKKENLNLDTLINNAGIGEWRPFMNIPLKNQMQNIDVNIKACTLLVRLFLDQTLNQNYPAYIMNVASMASFLPVPNYAVYSATKSYLRYLNQALNFELKGTNVSLTCLCPGGVETEFSSVAGNELTAISKMGMISSDRAAAVALKAMYNRKKIIIPGFDNIALIFILKYLPEKWAQIIMNFILSLGMKKDWEIRPND